MRRTPKNYDGIECTTKTLDDLLPQFLARIRKKKTEPVKDLLRAWPEVIGSAMAKFTEAVSFQDGVLTVVVKSSTLYSMLCQSEKNRILQLMQERFPIVQKLLFRRG